MKSFTYLLLTSLSIFLAPTFLCDHSGFHQAFAEQATFQPPPIPSNGTLSLHATGGALKARREVPTSQPLKWVSIGAAGAGSLGLVLAHAANKKRAVEAEGVAEEHNTRLDDLKHLLRLREQELNERMTQNEHDAVIIAQQQEAIDHLKAANERAIENAEKEQETIASLRSERDSLVGRAEELESLLDESETQRADMTLTLKEERADFKRKLYEDLALVKSIYEEQDVLKKNHAKQVAHLKEQAQKEARLAKQAMDKTHREIYNFAAFALEAITGKKSSEEGQEDCIEGLMAFEKFMVNFKKVHPDQTWEEHMAEIRKNIDKALAKPKQKAPESKYTWWSGEGGDKQSHSIDDENSIASPLRKNPVGRDVWFESTPKKQPDHRRRRKTGLFALNDLPSERLDADDEADAAEEEEGGDVEDFNARDDESDIDPEFSSGPKPTVPAKVRLSIDDSDSDHDDTALQSLAGSASSSEIIANGPRVLVKVAEDSDSDDAEDVDSVSYLEEQPPVYPASQLAIHPSSSYVSLGEEGLEPIEEESEEE